MSFNLYTGLMGGGKSYAGAETALQAAKEGALIHTNLPLVQEEWEKLGLWGQIVKLPRDPSKWIKFTKQEVDGEMIDVPSSDCITGGAEGRENLVIYDEASLTFRTKDQAKNKDPHQPVFDLIALSRHVGLEIIFLAQDENNVSADLRRLAQWRTHCVAVKEIPMIGAFAVRLVGEFKRIVYKGTGKRAFMTSYHRFSLKIGALYKTHGMAESVAMRVDATRKTKGMDTGKKKGLLIFVGGPLLCLLAAGFALWKIKGSIFDKNAKKPKIEQVEGSEQKPEKKAEPKKRKGGLRVMEWEPEDELVFAVQAKTSQNTVVYARGGWKLGVGLNYMGEQIVEYVPYAGWHYFKTEFGRVIVVRPIYPEERAELPPVTIQGQAQQEDNGVTPATPITSAIDDTIKTLRGN